MARETQQSPKRRRLAAALRALRVDAGISGRELAGRLDWSQSKLSKIEKATTKPTRRDVEQWADALHADAGRRRELVDLADTVQVEAQTWRDIYRTAGGIDRRQQVYTDRDARTASIVIYQPAMVPGLLQTAEYARQVLAGVDVEQDSAAVGRAVSARLERQSVMLYDETKSVEFLITEAALRWLPGGSTAVLGAQLDRILTLMTLPSIQLGVIPLGTGGPAPLGPIVLRRFVDDEDPLVTVESLKSEENIPDPDDVAAYERALEEYRKVAVFGEDARRELARIAGDYRLRA